MAVRLARYALVSAGAVILLTGTALAAPDIGPSFFVADPRTDGEAFPAVTATPDGFVVAWVADGEVAYRRLNNDATLGEPGSVVFAPFESHAMSAHSTTTATPPVELVEFDRNALLVYQSVTEGTVGSIGSVSFYIGYEPSWVVVPASSAPGPATTEVRSLLFEPSFASAALGSQWAVLAWSSGETSGSLELSLIRGDAYAVLETSVLSSRPLPSPGTLTVELADVGIASDGVGYLAVWAEGADLSVRRISSAGASQEIDTPAGWSTMGPVRLASNGDGYLVAWVDPSRVLRVSPVTSDGEAASADGILVAGGVTGILDLDAAGSSYMITYESAGDAGIEVRAARVSAEGSVEDPEGFELSTTTEIGIAGISDNLWLSIVASHALEDRTLLEGRFIGDVIPPAPDNPVPPPSEPDADGGVPDAGSELDAGGNATGGPDSAIAGGNGGSGAPGGTGDSGAAGATGATPGEVSDGTDGGSPEGVDVEHSEGCGCRLSSRSSRAGAHVWLALAALALSRRRRAASR
jgi:hypothetical protein